MLWNTFHKLVLFHHIQFQLLVLTATPNLKLNATTFQIICNLQKKTRTIMDRKNVSKSEQRPNRNLVSISCSSGTNNIGSLRPQRAQSQLVFGANIEANFYQTMSLHEIPRSPMITNGFCYPRVWNENFENVSNPNLVYINPYVCPAPSPSGLNVQYQGNYLLPPDQGSPKRRNKQALERKWETIRVSHKSDKKFVFSLMSYNVLAQDLVNNHEYLYKNHRREHLQWHARWVNILKEIGDVNPDIICFQEVQESHIQEYFAILERKLGYKSIYKKRTGIRPDGCAIYYKRKRLQLLQFQKVEFFQENVPVLNRDNVAIVARFIPKEVHSNAFVVATTHLLYNPKRQDVRLAQIQNLVAEIDKIAFSHTNTDGSASYLPVIITGDLNATPDSAIYEFITRGVLDYENLTKRGLQKELGKELTGKVLVPSSLQMTDNCQYAEMVVQRCNSFKKKISDGGDNAENIVDTKLKFSSGTLSHPFTLKSAYEHIRNNDDEGTTYQDKWITVDYIFFSGKKQQGVIVDDKLKLLSRYQLFTKTQLQGVKIPNWSLGSDHFSLIVKFSLE